MSKDMRWDLHAFIKERDFHWYEWNRSGGWNRSGEVCLLDLLRGAATVVGLLWPSPLAVFATLSRTFLKRVWCHMPLPPPSHGTITNQPKCCPPTEPFNSQPSPSNSWPVTSPLSAQWHLHWHHLCLRVCVCVFMLGDFTKVLHCVDLLECIKLYMRIWACQ